MVKGRGEKVGGAGDGKEMLHNSSHLNLILSYIPFVLSSSLACLID